MARTMVEQASEENTTEEWQARPTDLRMELYGIAYAACSSSSRSRSFQGAISTSGAIASGLLTKWESSLDDRRLPPWYVRLHPAFGAAAT
jgi:hypothetical protein